MAFQELLGNDRLKDELRQSLRSGHGAHFYMISGPEGSGKRTLARLLAQALMCEGPEPGCGRCEGCRKVRDGVHPDFITVDDPEHKTVAVKLVRDARDDVYIRPNEGRRKIYLFPQELGLPGQNALLKILEEPPAYAVFLLITDNEERLLPTVRSRCRVLKMSPLSEDLLRRELGRRGPDAGREAIDAAIARSGGYLGQAERLLEGSNGLAQQTLDFVEAFGRRDAMGLVRVLVPMEKMKRDVLIPILDQWAQILQEALACRAGGRAISEQARALATARSSKDLLEAIGHLKKCVGYAQSNVSCAAICGYLQWALR